jgi:hypothetical protein
LRGQASQEQFIFFYAVFLAFVVYVGGLYGQSLVTNVPSPPSTFQVPNSTISGPFTTFTAPLGYFFQLYTTNFIFTEIYSILFAPFLIVLGFILFKAIRGS